MRIRTIAGIALVVALVSSSAVMMTTAPRVQSPEEKICEDADRLIADFAELEREYRDVEIPAVMELNLRMTEAHLKMISHATCSSNADCRG